MKCPKNSSYAVLYAVYKRVDELQARYDTFLTLGLSNSCSLLFKEIHQLKAFLRANNFPLP